MKASIAAISAVAALLSSRPSTVHAAPGNVAQIVLGEGGSRSAVSNTRDYVHHLFEEYASGASASASAGNVVEKGASWVREHINDPRFTHVTHAAFPEYRLRLNKHDDEKKHTLCDPGVKQHSGYVDTPDDAHLFFWFFESRDNPKKDPVTLWLNGGPGCSSTTGLLFELGPCLIADNGTSTVFNPYSWNSNSNVIFLDSPRNVGLSYTNGKGVFTTPEAAADVYAFLNLWMKQYPEYNQGQDFNIAGESYAGTYIPQFASYIHDKQKGRKHSSVSPVEEHKDINLRNLLIGNGLTDPYYQFASVPDYACAPSEHAFVDESQCTTMRNKVSTCQRLETYCYDNPSRFTCVPAALYCWGMYSPMQATGRNLYDVRKTCNRDEDADGPLCYKELGWIESWLNRSEVKEELGAPKELKFASCDMKINQNFLMTGDSQHNSAAFLPPLIEDGIRVLVYAGNMDAMCNALGNERWFKALDNKYAKEIKNTKERIYQVKGKDAGRVISAGEGAGNFTFIEIFDAGHMVPTDQPVVALDMFNRFIKNERF